MESSLLPCHAMPSSIYKRPSHTVVGRNVMTRSVRFVCIQWMSCHFMSTTVHVADWFYSYTPFTKGILALHSFGRPNHHHHRRKVRWWEERDNWEGSGSIPHRRCHYHLLPMKLPPSSPAQPWEMLVRREIIVNLPQKSKVAGIEVGEWFLKRCSMVVISPPPPGSISATSVYDLVNSYYCNNNSSNKVCVPIIMNGTRND